MTLRLAQSRGQSRVRALEGRVALLRRENGELQAALDAAKREHREFVAAGDAARDRLLTILERLCARLPVHDADEVSESVRHELEGASGAERSHLLNMLERVSLRLPSSTSLLSSVPGVGWLLGSRSR
jgi:hypothetical protein